MIRSLFSILLSLLLLGNAFAQDNAGIDFIRNERQFPDPVRYKAFLPGGAVFLRNDGFTYSYYSEKDIERIHELRHEGKDVYEEPVRMHAYALTFRNALPSATMTEEGQQAYYHNYFLGSDPSHWAGQVPLFRRITWNGLYPGIDAVAYSKGRSLKYDFIVQPGADPAQIVLGFEGVNPQLAADGSLILKTSVNTIREAAPYVYQETGGRRVQVSCRYRINADRSVSFAFPAGYDRSKALVIDPVLVFSTYSGATVSTFGFSATYDATGALYAGGECFGPGWPSTPGAFQVSFSAGVDAGINKYSSAGNALVYATYYGGGGFDLPNNMMVNSSGELVICGSTNSVNLPVTPGCFDNSYNGSTDIYIARFNANGTQLRAATYLGGSATDGLNTGSLSPNYGDGNRGEVLTAANGSIYIASSSSSANFPVSAGALQTSLAGMQDGVVCKLDSSLSVLQYSTYLGGTQEDAAFSLVLNSAGEIVVCGGTKSSNFPTTAGALQTAGQGLTDGFASIINTSTGLSHSTYLGTAAYDHAFKIQIDALDDIFVMGQTAKTSGYPISAGVYSVANGDIFIHKLNPTLSTSLLSTRLGCANASTFVPTAFLHDLCGNTYLSGFGASDNMPLTPNAYQTAPGSFWLGALGPDFSNLLYATYFGPQGTHVDGGTSRFDPQGIIYHSACTISSVFPTTPGVVHPSKLSPSWDIASYKFNMEVGAVLADFMLANNANDTGCADYTVAFENLSYGATQYSWDFGDGSSPSTQVNPTHTFPEGTHRVVLTASRANGCNLSDTASMLIVVKQTDKPLLNLRDTFLCDPVPITLTAPVSNLSGAMSFHWEPAAAISSDPDFQTVSVNPAVATTYTVYIANASTAECVDTAMGTIHISLFDYSNMTALPLDTLICPGDTVRMRAYGGSAYHWQPPYDIADVNSAVTAAWPATDRSYTVSITNDSGCSIDRGVLIHLLPLPHIDAGEDQDIKLGESTRLEGRGSGSCVWLPAGAVYPDNILTPLVAPLRTTTYYLELRSPEGCRYNDSVTIHVTNAMLPNAFSPNGDGVNDRFRLAIMDERVRLKDFSVYNRYGQRVFFTRDVEEGWDGNFEGKPADISTYFYYVRYIIGVKTYTLKGDVTLLR